MCLLVSLPLSGIPCSFPSTSFLSLFFLCSVLLFSSSSSLVSSLGSLSSSFPPSISSSSSCPSFHSVSFVSSILSFFFPLPASFPPFFLPLFLPPLSSSRYFVFLPPTLPPIVLSPSPLLPFLLLLPFPIREVAPGLCPRLAISTTF